MVPANCNEDVKGNYMTYRVRLPIDLNLSDDTVPGRTCEITEECLDLCLPSNIPVDIDTEVEVSIFELPLTSADITQVRSSHPNQPICLSTRVTFQEPFPQDEFSSNLRYYVAMRYFENNPRALLPFILEPVLPFGLSPLLFFAWTAIQFYLFYLAGEYTREAFGSGFFQILLGLPYAVMTVSIFEGSSLVIPDSNVNLLLKGESIQIFILSLTWIFLSFLHPLLYFVGMIIFIGIAVQPIPKILQFLGGR